MDPNAVVLEISSDEEGGWNNKDHVDRGVIDGSDDYNWISDILDEVNRDDCVYDDDSDDVVLVGEVLPKKPRRKSAPKSASLIDFDDDCVVLDHDPDKPPEARKDDPSDPGDEDDDDDDIVVVSEKGQVACRDYPHPRHLCIKFPFSSTPNQSHCDQCYCYVCDSLAPCIYWGNGSGGIDHCLATDKSDFWKVERQNSKNVGKDVGVAPLKPVPQTPSIDHSQTLVSNPIRSCPVPPSFVPLNIANQDRSSLLLSRNKFQPGLVSQQLTRTSSCTVPGGRVHHGYNQATPLHRPVFKRTASDMIAPTANRYIYSPYSDARDSIGSVDSVSDGDDDLGVIDFKYNVWSVAPESVCQRKNTFFKFMGLRSDDDDEEKEEEDERFSRMRTRTSGAVLRSDVKEEEGAVSCNDLCLCSSRIRDSNGEEAAGKLLKVEPAPLVQKFVDRDVKVAHTMSRTMSKVKGRVLDRLRSMACNAVQKRAKPRCIELGQWAKVQRVKVHQSKKRLKELSAVFIGQDIQAHEGSILTMKFSLDGRYLASAGEDAVVRVWQVVEDERSNEIDVPDVDPSCLYFTVNNLAELAPLAAEKQKISMLKSLKKTKNSACVIFPPKVFRILEKPVHEFRGHKGDVLDLSWSKDNFLLSSSVDETVRLWRVGNDSCLKIFPHSNYVTCVQFQPTNENYFISGSIDGKVRIWSVSGCQVVDWIDIREIVTAVAYSPDGKGGVIGSMTGCCSFFSVSGNRLQLEASVALNSKKKSPCKRIIGFQFCPQDSSKVMVTSADSHVRILNGPNVIGKFRGQRNAGNPFCASFTSDGRHIVSASEDSNVYVWDCGNQNKSCFSKQKTVRSYEWFYAGASVALPWSGRNAATNSMPPCNFSLGQDFFLESGPKASATWPEEKLPSSSPLCKSKYNFFRSSSQSSYNSNTWGMVIVTAGWDGRIRSFLNYGLPATV